MSDRDIPRYVKIDAYHSVPVLKISREEFVRLMKEFNAPILYFKESRAETRELLSEFMFYHGGLMYICNGQGYRNLTDLASASSQGFDSSSNKYSVSGGDVESTTDSYRGRSSDGEVYYFATGLGYKDFHEFDDAASRGFGKQKAEEYRFATSKGLENSNDYERYKQFRKSMNEA